MDKQLGPWLRFGQILACHDVWGKCSTVQGCGCTRRIFVGGSEPMVPVRDGLVTQVAGCSQGHGMWIVRRSLFSSTGKR